MKSFSDFLNEEHKSMAGKEGEVYELNGAWIDIHLKPTYAPRSQSVIEFFVPETTRGQGIGTKLLRMAMHDHNDIGAQVSSLASLKVFYNCGFRNPELVEGTFNDHVGEFKENGGSLFMAMCDENGKRYL